MGGSAVILIIFYRIFLVISNVMQPRDLLLSLVSMVSQLIFLLLWIGTQGKGMGFGDVKLALPLGHY
jgi:prepilin signal peptidase PulO-like enzyme (type II secretory pathway)